MKRAARTFVGRHDFRTFEASGGRRKSAVRTVHQLEVKREGKIIRFTIEGNGFLYKMVRNMVGTLILVGSGKIRMSNFKKILQSKNRELAGPTAPSQGLTLKRVVY
ncbi:MAG: hypothetical protein HY583_02985 [Candidatus Omnitrophica bacterium]|nr:hypothetical protein [Candidatus Omnitrophota bacterium]